MYADIVGEIGSFRCLWNLLYGAYVFVMVIKDMNGVFFVCLQGWTLIFYVAYNACEIKASAFIVMMISEVHRNFYYRITKDNANRCNDKPS